jgi:peptide/nickel transport system permease protein
VLLAVAISGALGPGLSNSLIALTLVFVPQIVRVAGIVAHASATTRLHGSHTDERASAFSIIRVHVWVDVLGPVFVYATGLLSVSMILASGLSFLGLGAEATRTEWGLMLNTLHSAIQTSLLLQHYQARLSS